MNSRSRLGLQRLEERDNPASFSALLSGGAVVSGSFSTPDGVDTAQSSQVVELTDLSVTKGGVSYTAAPVPLAYYSHGALTRVVANLYTPDDQIDLSWNGTAVFTPASGPTETGTIAYDVADAQATFTLPDGTVGTISYQIPWDQVDPSQSSQSVTPTAFNLNIAGQNFAYGTANFTNAPTIQFANGDLTGVVFALNLTGTGSPYSSISVSNGVATAVAATGTVLNADLIVANKVIKLDFSKVTTGQAYEIRVQFAKADGTPVVVPLAISVTATMTKADIMQLIVDSFDGLADYKARIDGINLTIIVKNNSVKTVTYQTLKPNLQPDNTFVGPSFGGRQGLCDVTVNGTKITP